MSKKIQKNNRLVAHPAYGAIMAAYTEALKTEKKVNTKRFFEQWVAPNVKDYTYVSFTRFIARFKSEAEILAPMIAQRMSRAEGELMETDAKLAIVDNATATQRGIAHALNMGMKAIEDIANGTAVLSTEKRAEFLFKAMNAQNQRIHAMATIRKDNREEKQFQQSFNDAAYIRPELEDEEVEDLTASLEGIEEPIEGEIL